MDYENKYNEVVEKARAINSGKYVDIPAGDTILEYIFPELKESENERIRKDVLAFIRREGQHIDKYKWHKWLAWLEKQGEPTEINPSEFDSQLNKLLKQFESLPKEELASSLSFYLNVVHNDGTYKEEKQGEKSINDTDEEYNGEDYGIDSLYHAISILEKTLGKVEGYQTDDGILSHQCAITAVKKLYEQKPVGWSEEDVAYIDELTDFFEHCGELHQPQENVVNWLKSIKERLT